MRPHMIMFLGWLFAAGTLISLTFGGGWFESSDIDTLNSMVAFRQASVLSVWSIPVPNLDYALAGLGAFMKLDFAFFTGEMELIRWVFFMVIISAALWGIFSVVIGTATTLWRR